MEQCKIISFKRKRELDISTFFFIYFSEKKKAKELYNIFKVFSEIDEVIVPTKRDIMDK